MRSLGSAALADQTNSFKKTAECVYIISFLAHESPGFGSPDFPDPPSGFST
jgi:hypothetical protein